ncbi:hypothetical protein VTH82DRAFT_2154 [Thermothelomyces myriococcoides]
MVPDSRLQQLAKDAARHACGLASDPLPLPPNADPILTNLPRELRLRILEYTDLVTPTREVIWSREDHSYRVITPDNDCLNTVEESYKVVNCWDPYDSRTWKSPNPGCFCSRRHAAFSHACQCWAPPRASLFLVCRTLYEDAQYIFFSKNRFIVHDYKIKPPWALPFDEGDTWDEDPPKYPYPYERFAISHFLREVVPKSSLAHLRFLELVFPPYRPGSWPPKHHPAMRDWRATVYWLRSRVNPRQLTIQLAVSDLGDTDLDPFYYPITVQGAWELLGSYANLVQPLAWLGNEGLARFYAHFPHRWEWTDEFMNKSADTWSRLRDAEIGFKERAERRVLGSRYDSLHADGTKEPHLGTWHEI